MFLANLTDKQKQAFLGLAHNVVMADGVLREIEISTMEQYKKEMGIGISLESIKNADIECSSAVFKAAPTVVKKQVVFELTALAYADKEYALSEGKLIDKIRKMLDIDDTFFEKCGEYAQNLMEIYEKIGELVG